MEERGVRERETRRLVTSLPGQGNLLLRHGQCPDRESNRDVFIIPSGLGNAYFIFKMLCIFNLFLIIVDIQY